MIPDLEDLVAMMIPALLAVVIALAFDLPAKVRNALPF